LGGRLLARSLEGGRRQRRYGNIGQTNYGAAKAGIAAFTIIAAKELARYGVTVNALAPGARTRMTENLQRARGTATPEPEEFDARSPDNVAPIVAWLASVESAGVTGRVFNVAGGRLSVAEGWHAGPITDKGGRWYLVAQAPLNAAMNGVIPWPEETD
jgi:NAD(P)-dependent dehydrogenase (short-subunit alcohol dehydrogenase family)